MLKTLDEKLAAIHADPHGCREFILADAKDADMAFGIGAPGLSPEAHAGEVRLRTLAEYREQIRQIVRQGRVDIMLMSASTNDVLAHQEQLFANSPVTPAARANDTTDIFAVRGNRYVQEPSQPFRSAAIDHIQCGRLDCEPRDRILGTNLGLYSITFNNRLDEDLRALCEYQAFREEAERKGFRHFLELFDPNAPQGLTSEAIPGFINDVIARTLAGVATAGRPVFLKMVYHGPRALEELVSYDPHLVVGILGGSAGTTYDAFKMLAEAQKYGTRVALYGRKINHAENQLAFIEFLRLIADRLITPEDAVRAYHAVLGRLGIRPHRRLADDLELQSSVMSYGGSARASVPADVPVPAERAQPARVESATGLIPNGWTPAANRHGPITLGLAAQPCACGGHAVECHCDDAGKAGTTPTDAGRVALGHECSCHTGEGKHQQKTPGNMPGVAKETVAKPDFTRMTTAEKLAWNKARRDRIFGV